VRQSYKNVDFLSDLELAYEQLWEQVYYLGPLREHPKRQYLWSGAQPTGVGSRGERTIDALLASSRHGKYLSQGPGRGKKKRTLQEQVAFWLQELKLVSNFQIKAISKTEKIYQVLIQADRNSTFVPLPDVGFGVSQILPVLTLLYYVPERSVLLLEQPEIHLHPSVQAGLADVFIDAIKTRKVQIIVESHSEHLLRRLQRRIAEEKLSAKEAALYFVTYSQGESRIESLQLDSYGRIENWPENFFGDDFAEIAAMQKAILKRQKVSANGT
ncbi:MAG: DUF3696 domain-containing protein, partial [Rhodothermus sp.]|nr:DUF3696 domain-containing protein [Rhodothermus sp.]